MAGIVDVATVKEQHRGLEEEFSARGPEIMKAPGTFLAKLDKLLRNMREVSAEVTSSEDYVWLQEKVRDWRLLSSSSLNTPKQTTLLPPKQALRPPVGRAKLSSEMAPDKWRGVKAHELFVRRLVTRHYATTENEIIEQELGKLDQQQRDREQGDDWLQSGLYLAAEVLDGRRPFACETYRHLEGACWLDELRKLKAYLMWQERGGWGEVEMRRYYFEGCDQIRQRLVDPDVKLSQTAAEPILEYVRSQYLKRRENGAWELDETRVRNLVEVKARRVWELTPGDDDNNWYCALKYTRDFYDNIIPAIAGNGKKIESILDALQLHGHVEGPNLVNCFEMSVAIHCLDHMIVRNLLQLPQLTKAA
jgi:hypothetical protein